MLDLMPGVLCEKVKECIRPNRSGSLHCGDKHSEKLLFLHPVASPDSCPTALLDNCSGAESA